jgi:hypothetical protein
MANYWKLRKVHNVSGRRDLLAVHATPVVLPEPPVQGVAKRVTRSTSAALPKQPLTITLERLAWQQSQQRLQGPLDSSGSCCSSQGPCKVQLWATPAKQDAYFECFQTGV